MVARASSASVTEGTAGPQNARVEFQEGLDGSCPQAWPSVVWPPMILQLGTNFIYSQRLAPVWWQGHSGQPFS